MHKDVAGQHLGDEGVDGGAVDHDELPRQVVQRAQLALQPITQRLVLARRLELLSDVALGGVDELDAEARDEARVTRVGLG